jgi:hypothetical protein
MNIRNRVKSLRMVPASDLRPNPKNWRTHPKAQADALRGVLSEIGLADACLARELPDGSLMLIDGHLRAETLGDGDVPVLVLDVNEAEADKLLATLDPLAAMADSDAARFEELLRNVDTGSEALQQMLAATAAQAGLYGQLAETNLDGGDDDQDDEYGEELEEANPYTPKTQAPVYEPTGEKPSIDELCDSARAEKLLADIDKSDAPEAVKKFLRAAAYRHVVFNFEKVANFYAHSDAKCQRLMEDSALVIVDFNRAVEMGYARLSERLSETYAEEKGADDAE